MKRTEFFKIGIIAVLALGVLYTSCKKDNPEPTPTTNNYKSATDNSTAEGIFNRSYDQVDKGAKATYYKGTDTTTCPTMTVTGTSWPKTFTLDYGTGCTCQDGYIRSGKIVSTIDAPYFDSLCTITTTFQNYKEKFGTTGTEYSVTGTQVIENLGHTNLGHPIFSVNVTNASVSSVNGTISWTSTRTNEWTSGYSSYMNPFDDVYLVTGSSSGIDGNGAPFSVNITSPLQWQYCTTLYRWLVVGGSLEVINPGYPTIYVDYGTGTCDANATVTVNGQVYQIYM
ncbi:MAG: hypothetical protein HXX09_10570 [Bacteroidetes bacterium]|nr:hypothetical protein [Bacteroidota bacterium]